MGQNFDQAKRDNTFWPMPNILEGSVLTHQGFINFFKGNRFCEFTGNFENDVQAKATVIGCMKEDETIVNIEMPNKPMKKLLLRNGVTFYEEI